MKLKNVLKKIFTVLFVLTLLAALTACGGGKVDASDPNQGLWKATTGEMMGLSMDVTDFFEQGFTIELQDNGKCAIEVDGEKANGKWTLESGAITVKGGGLDLAGRLEDGLLTLENVMDMGLNLTFEKEGGTSANTAAAKDASKDEAITASADTSSDAASDAGYYVIDSMIIGTDTIEGEMLSALEMEGCYIILNEDGTSELVTEAAFAGTWEDGVFTYEESGEEVNYPYTLEGDLLTMEMESDGVTLIFKRSDETPPSPTAIAASSDNVSGADGLSDALAWWEGDWYGSWRIASGSGAYDDLVDQWWDCYWTIDITGDNTGVVTWRDDEAFIGEVAVAFDLGGYWKLGTLKAVGGTLFDAPVEEEAWLITPETGDYENMIIIDEWHEDSDGESFSYEVILRPWGMDWEDVPEDMRPPYYADWYLGVMDMTMDEAIDAIGSEDSQTPAIAEPNLRHIMVGLTFEELDATLEAYGMTREMTTYEDIGMHLGISGLRDDNHSSDTYSVTWYASDNGYATVFFDKETNLYKSWSTSGYGRPEGWTE